MAVANDPALVVAPDTWRCARRSRLTASTTAPGEASPWAARRTSTSAAPANPAAYRNQPADSQTAARRAARSALRLTWSPSRACRSSRALVTPNVRSSRAGAAVEASENSSPSSRRESARSSSLRFSICPARRSARPGAAASSGTTSSGGQTSASSTAAPANSSPERISPRLWVGAAARVRRRSRSVSISARYSGRSKCSRNGAALTSLPMSMPSRRLVLSVSLLPSVAPVSRSTQDPGSATTVMITPSTTAPPRCWVAPSMMARNPSG